MSTPSSDLTAFGVSITSSGFSDGLGRRSLAFDREGGAMLDRLTVRPDLAAFELAIRDRVERIGSVDHDRISHVRAMERNVEGSLVVVSEFVPGTRLCDLLETAAADGIVPGVDVALGFLLDALPVLCALHAGTGGPHGAISPTRIVLTPAGQVVLLDAVFGSAIAKLSYSRQRLWQQFGVAMPPSARPARFDQATDVAQMALCAMMLVAGRPIRTEELPGALPALLSEVTDVAMIRGTIDFATALEQFLQRTLPLPNSHPYDSADDALVEVRNLAREIGPAACRRAMVDFVAQLDSPGAEAEAAYAPYEEAFAAAASHHAAARDDAKDEASFDDILNQYVSPEAVPSQSDYDLPRGFDYLSTAEPDRSYDEPQQTHAPSSFDSFDLPADPIAEQPAAGFELPDASHAYSATESLWASPEPIPDPAPVAPEPFFAPSVVPPEPVAFAPEPMVHHAQPVKAAEPPQPSAADDPLQRQAPEPPQQHHGSNRKKKKAIASARAKKDKLRSVLPAAGPLKPAVSTPEPPKVPVAAAPAPQPRPWLIPPDRAAAFEPIQEPRIAPPPAPPSPPVPHVPLAASRPAPSDDPFGTRAPFRPLTPHPAPPPVVQPIVKPVAAPVALPKIGLAQPTASVSSSPSPVKLKMDAPPGYNSGKAQKPAPKPAPPTPNIYTPPPVISTPESSSFPWKPVAAAAAVLGIALTAGVMYWPGGTEATPKTAAAPSAPEKSGPTPAPADPLPTGKNGRIEIETQPAGARVLLDGKAVGTAPLALPNVPAGKHTLTFTSQAGTVRRTIKVEAGKTMSLDVPIFSGWVGVFAPIVLEVSTNGRAIGTTDQPRIMLPPGPHELTLSNRELGYTTTQTVEIEPGEVKSITLDPRGPLNLNALPWAEVFIDGAKVGETPLANLQVPLGVHEVVFKHPQHGERKMSVTVKANVPAALSVDFKK